MKPPAFQFYADDFVAGTVDLPSEEIGPYILLLCYQWSKGFVPDDDNVIRRIARITQAFSLSGIRSKFQLTPEGLKNTRLEQERQKQYDYRQKQAKNGQKGGRPKGLDNPSLSFGLTQTISQTKAKKSSPSPSPSPISLEREYPEPSRPTMAEVLAKADTIGLAPWKAADWFNEMEGGGWKDHAHRPIEKWDAVLVRVKSKWEADGRPSGPPRSAHSPKVRTNNHNI